MARIAASVLLLLAAFACANARSLLGTAPTVTDAVQLAKARPSPAPKAAAVVVVKPTVSKTSVVAQAVAAKQQAIARVQAAVTKKVTVVVKPTPARPAANGTVAARVRDTSAESGVPIGAFPAARVRDTAAEAGVSQGELPAGLARVRDTAAEAGVSQGQLPAGLARQRDTAAESGVRLGDFLARERPTVNATAPAPATSGKGTTISAFLAAVQKKINQIWQSKSKGVVVVVPVAPKPAANATARIRDTMAEGTGGNQLARVRDTAAESGVPQGQLPQH